MEEDISIESFIEENYLAELATQGRESESESSEVIYPIYIGSGASMVTDVLDAERNTMSRKTVMYTGEDISLEFYLNFEIGDEKIQTITATFFLLNNGIPQPFYWENATEESEYICLTCDKKEFAQDNFFKVRFQPAYVPYGEDTCMTMFVVIGYDYNFEYPGTVVAACCNGIPFYLTADQQRHQIEWDMEIPVCGNLAEYEWKYGVDSSGYGVMVAEKIVNASQLMMGTAFTSGEQLYAVESTTPDTKENEEMQLFAFMDGEPVALFDGSWYCSMYVGPEQLYEIPLDMNLIPSGEHLIYFMSLIPGQSCYMTKYGKIEDGYYTISNAATMYSVTIP